MLDQSFVNFFISCKLEENLEMTASKHSGHGLSHRLERCNFLLVDAIQHSRNRLYPYGGFIWKLAWHFIVLMRKHSDDKVQEVLLSIAAIECCSDIFLLWFFVQRYTHANERIISGHRPLSCKVEAFAPFLCGVVLYAWLYLLGFWFEGCSFTVEATRQIMWFHSQNLFIN